MVGAGSERALEGVRVLVTRSRAQASELCRQIEERGGSTYEFPVIRIEWPEDLGPLDAAIHSIHEFDWVAFTSPNGVTMFFERMRALGVEISALQAVQVAAVGPKTKALLEHQGVTVHALAGEYVGEGLADTLTTLVQAGQKILLPRAQIARKQLPAALRNLGLTVTEVDAYHTLPVAEDAAQLVQRLAAKEIDVVTFTSSSTVTHFFDALQGVPIHGLLSGVTVVAIGPITAETAQKHGLQVDVMPDSYTIPDLVAALVHHVQTPSRGGITP